jgi:5-methyltetrahydrofolate--homocysteine methyltransferase
VVSLPLSFDYPNVSVQEVCLKTYDPAKAKGCKPIVNSVTERRWEMLDVLKIQPAKVVFMASERVENGQEIANQDAKEIAHTAARMVTRVLSNGHGLVADDLLIDVSLCPLASDTEGRIGRAIEAIRLISLEPALRGVHTLVGLSNLGIMLPKQAIDGEPLPVRVESSFLTLTVPNGLDTILGTPGRNYQLLSDDDLVFRGFKEAIAIGGFESLLRVQELYQRN